MENNTLLIKNAIFLDKSKKDVYIENGYIIKIADRINRKVKKEINCYGEKAILPGLINCHTHSGMSFLQGYADDLPLKEWLEKKIWPIEAKMDAKDVYWATKLACLKMIKTGTTCLNDMYWFPSASWQAIKEMGLRVVLGLTFINSLTFNSNGLSRGAIPKIAIAMGKDAGYTQEQLEDAQDEWAANFEAMDGQWNIPLLNSDAKVLNLMPNNRDMEYQKYMEFTGALTCAIMGIDSSELGLRLNQAQAVLSENSDGKQIFSKNRGVREMLSGFSYVINRFLEVSGYNFANDFRFIFNGMSTEDKGFEADLRKKDVETIKTVDEVRAELDLPPLKDGLGDVILNSVFMQNKQALEMAAQGEDGDMAMGDDIDDDEGFGGFSDDEELDSMVDEAMDGMEKAVKLI